MSDHTPVSAADTTLSALINAAIVARMTPEFVEKEINGRVDKLLVESIDAALRRYSDNGKLIEKAVENALRVDRVDLPSYGAVVTAMLKEQIEACVAPVVAGRLARDMEELLGLAPKEIKLSQIAEDMIANGYHDTEYGPAITVEVEHTQYGSAWVYLDDDRHIERRAQYEAKYRLLVGKDGELSSVTIDGKATTDTRHFGRAYGLEQKLRAYVACGTKIILDEDAVVTAVGDY